MLDFSISFDVLSYGKSVISCDTVVKLILLLDSLATDLWCDAKYSNIQTKMSLFPK